MYKVDSCQLHTDMFNRGGLRVDCIIWFGSANLHKVYTYKCIDIFLTRLQ